MQSDIMAIMAIWHYWHYGTMALWRYGTLWPCEQGTKEAVTSTAAEHGARNAKAVVLPAAGVQINSGRPHIAPRATRTLPPDGCPCHRGKHPRLRAPVLELPSDAVSREAHSAPACRHA